MNRLSSPSPDSGYQPAARAPQPRKTWFFYAMAGLFVICAAVCIVQALRTRQQILKYAAPPQEMGNEQVAGSAPPSAAFQFDAGDFVEPFDPRPATAQLGDRIQAIKDHIAQLKSAGLEMSAADMQARLHTILAQRNGPYPLDVTPQLHAIGMYCGGEPWVRIEGMRSKGRSTARIKITYARAPLVLAFCAYFPVRWIVEVEPGVEIQKVILGAYYPHEVEGLPDGIPIEGHTNGNLDPAYKFYAETTLEGVPVADRLQKLAGLLPMTFQIMRQFRGSPVVIGPGGEEWTAAMTMHALGPLYEDAVKEDRARMARELISHRFTDVRCVINHRFHVGESAIAEHSIFGPYSDSLQPLATGTIQLAIDPRGPTLYGYQRNQGITVIDPKAGSAKPWPVNSVEFRAHRDAYLTFDARRNRLLAWDVDLLAIDPDTHEATVLRKGNPFVRGLVSSPEEDLLYVCCASSQRESVCNQVTITDLCALDAHGQELSRKMLAVPIPGGDWNDTAPAINLRIVGNKLLVTSIGASGASDYPYIAFDTNYIIDPKTGKLLFACRRQPR